VLQAASQNIWNTFSPLQVLRRGRLPDLGACIKRTDSHGNHLRVGPPTITDGLGAFIMYVVGAAVLFLAGGLFGDVVESIRHPESTEQPKLATRLASGVSRNKE
jgi:hypothetical protein